MARGCAISTRAMQDGRPVHTRSSGSVVGKAPVLPQREKSKGQFKKASGVAVQMCECLMCVLMCRWRWTPGLKDDPRSGSRNPRQRSVADRGGPGRGHCTTNVKESDPPMHDNKDAGLRGKNGTSKAYVCSSIRIPN
eukprot:53076-Chlamydomonas_euryale.AAC.5